MTGMRFRGLVGVFAAGSLVFSSTGAVAATASAPVAQVSPWAVLSVMSGGASALAACGASAAAAAAATAAQPAAGCVLPQVDVAPVAQPAGPPQPIPVPPVEPAGAGLGISPLLLGLAAIAAGIGLYFALRDNNHSNSPR